MRITGGVLCGRRVTAPRAGTRPTQDMVREALFAVLGARIEGSRFLDLYAGSGAVGIDAWSRGAATVCWVESGRRVLDVLRRNVRDLCDGEGRVDGSDALRFLEKARNGGEFDIIFGDPPYAGRDERSLAGAILHAVDGGGALRSGGVVIVESRSGGNEDVRDGWQLEGRRRYGDTELAFYRRA